MKFIDVWVERFCYKHPRFGIPNLMRYIVIITAAVYLIGALDTTGTFYSYLTFSPELILHGQVWRLISFVFISHYASLTQLFWFLMFAYFYYFIGSSLEAQWGTARFNIYYFSAVVLSVVYGFVAGAFGIQVEWEMTGYYINMALFFAFAALWPDYTVMIFFVLPVKMKYLAVADALLFVYEILTYHFFFPLVPIVHFLLFCGYMIFGMFKGAGKRTVRKADFRTRILNSQFEEKAKGYRHKCSVCGKTDTEYPDLQFRYCSKCVGYHCFCEEHINSHVHFTE